MKSEATITVSCDKCEREIIIELTALAMPGAWDERNVLKEMEVEGWAVIEDPESGEEQDICYQCIEDSDPDDEESENDGDED